MQLYQSDSNTIGTNSNGVNDAYEYNVISGNTGQGIRVLTGSDNNIFAGNRIGTDASGMFDLGNGSFGILIDGGSLNNRIGSDGNGTSDSEESNVISGNNADGILIVNNSTGNAVAGNFIGTTIDGLSALDNSGEGIETNSSSTVIGGTTAALRNVISGNTSYGVYLSGGSSSVVVGNIIGLNAAGNAKIANSYGVYVNSANNTIGGTTSTERNIISGNTNDGVYITGASATGNVIQGNYIGTDVTGTVALGNGRYGIQVSGGADGNTIGGSASGAGNLISGNASSG
ncbi:MAG: hypothetical protein KDA59_08920, partial [Planctomycetales bacterium]|nr:hypothetical protein [Planctomycetales bacterium]